jgi:hypothetical protein
VTEDRLHDLLTAANPVTTDAAHRLRVAGAQGELLGELLAVPRQPRRLRRRRAVPRTGLAIGALAAAVASVFVLVARPGDHGPATAWGAEQVRFAEASPLVLLGAPGWRVEYADEESVQEGELHFRSADTGSADLNWRSGPLRDWTKDRAHDAAVATTAPVLGTTAHVYQYAGGTPGHRDITALFRYDGRVLEFRAGAADVAAFKALLATLKRVDTDTWLSAMPASVVKTADRTAVVQQMLEGVTVPPGFDAKKITGGDLTKDRYQLGATVAGTVACEWFKRWSEARAASNSVKEREAIAAMATAKDWPILKEMAKQGAYPEVLLGYAKAMPSGRWYGRPLLGELDAGLGCKGFGVDLKP